MARSASPVAARVAWSRSALISALRRWYVRRASSRSLANVEEVPIIASRASCASRSLSAKYRSDAVAACGAACCAMTLTCERTRVMPTSVTASTATAPRITTAVQMRRRSGLVSPFRLVVLTGTACWTATADGRAAVA